MNVLRLNGAGGISGDMFLSLVFSLGLEPDRLQACLGAVVPFPFSFVLTPQRRSSVAVKTVTVVGGDRSMTLAEMRECASSEVLSPTVRSLYLDALDLLGEAEARVHGAGEAALHELGTLDTVVDLLGAFIAIELLEVSMLSVTDVALGSGAVTMAHGVLPNPGPAVAMIFTNSQRIRVTFRPEEFEWTTPTGASLLVALDRAGMVTQELSSFSVASVGYGAGERENPIGPNLLQGLLGSVPEPSVLVREVAVLSVHLDDLSGELLGGLVDEAHDRGALDAWISMVIGKKGRPGYEVTILASTEMEEELVQWLHRRTASPGLRYRREQRSVVDAQMRRSEFEGREIRLKSTIYGEKPEFEDLKAAADALGLSVVELHRRLQVRDLR